eukprot:maker-scaffold_41-snap-gene-0.30-mRNA-1 protein AED:0.25 eAED:0.25 QI:0/0/0.5/1/1/1/2/177/351
MTDEQVINKETVEKEDDASQQNVRKSARKRKPKVDTNFLTFDEFRMPARRPPKKLSLSKQRKNSISTQSSATSKRNEKLPRITVYQEVFSKLYKNNPTFAFDTLYNTLRQSFSKSNGLPKNFPKKAVLLALFAGLKNKDDTPLIIDSKEIEFIKTSVLNFIKEKPRSTFVSVFKKLNPLVVHLVDKYGMEIVREQAQEIFTSSKSKKKDKKSLENNFFVSYMKYLVVNNPGANVSEILQKIQIIRYENADEKKYPGDKVIKKYHKIFNKQVRTCVAKGLDPKILLQPEKGKGAKEEIKPQEEEKDEQEVLVAEKVQSEEKPVETGDDALRCMFVDDQWVLPPFLQVSPGNH